MTCVIHSLQLLEQIKTPSTVASALKLLISKLLTYTIVVLNCKIVRRTVLQQDSKTWLISATRFIASGVTLLNASLMAVVPSHLFVYWGCWSWCSPMQLTEKKTWEIEEHKVCLVKLKRSRLNSRNEWSKIKAGSLWETISFKYMTSRPPGGRLNPNEWICIIIIFKWKEEKFQKPAGEI